MNAVLVFVLRMLATSALTIIVARVAERTGPFIASTILTLPLFAGPSFFFLMFEVPPAFLAESALYAFAGTGAVLAFASGYVVAVRRVGLLASLGCAALAWLGLAAPLHVVQPTAVTALAWCALGAFIAWRTRVPANLHLRPGTGRAHWLPLTARALVAGAAVAAVSAAGAFIGPKLTGLVVAFPLTLSVSAWLVFRQYGAEFSAAMLASTQRTLVSYASFCGALALLAERMPIELAFACAVGVSVLSALSLVWVGMRARRRVPV